MIEYKNGNASVSLSNCGTREIEYDGILNLEWPLNIDIRVSTKCSFGYNPKTNSAFCSFCHEEARTDGSECDYEELQDKLSLVPAGIELAIGANNLTDNLISFLSWAKEKGFICNLTINQGHLRRDLSKLMYCIDEGFIKGLGVSYRAGVKWDVPKEILEYGNTVFHVIAGIDSFTEVEALKELGVKKVLVLGEKDFGFNKGNVDLNTRAHKEWVWWVHKLFGHFDAISFDNLALEQLRLNRFFTNENWETFNQGEHSFFVDSVNKVFKPSSRSYDKISWNEINIKEYFSFIDK